MNESDSVGMQASRLLNRILERCWELRLGINTRGYATADELGLREDGLAYSPIAFRGFFRAMEHVPKNLLTGTFLDYGAGKGRSLVLAARYYKFRRVIGVEMNAELCGQATRNLKRIAARQAEIICGDAATYEPPSDTTVFFLYNPFLGETMKAVVQNVRKSLVASPREAAIVVFNTRNFREATADQSWFTEWAAGKMQSSPLNWQVFVTRSGLSESS